jgi:hypothetical protein
MALQTGSPAINASDNTCAPAYDQRGPGFPRIVGGNIDIGTLEVQNIGGLAVSGFPAATRARVPGSLMVTALNPDGTPDTGYTGTVHFTSSDPQAVLPADATLSNGTGRFSATPKTVGYQPITATDTKTATITGAASKHENRVGPTSYIGSGSVAIHRYE